MKIEFTSDISSKDGIKCIVHGNSGSGKTVLAATAPGPLIFSAEKGLLSLKRTKVPYIDISNYKQLNEAFTWAMSSAETKNYETFCLDSLSEIAEVILEEEKRKNKDGRAAHGATQDICYKMMRAFRDIKGKNVYFIAKTKMIDIVEDFQTYQRFIPIMPNNALQQQVPFFFDLVLHLYVGTDLTTNKQYRAIHTQEKREWQAKDRSGLLAEIEPANLTNIFKKAVGVTS